MPSPQRPAPVVLIGFMGCGKSRIARALAARLRCPAIDVDALIEAAAQMPISEIFATLGEEKFREIETAQLREAMQQSGVIATGGGIVTRKENRALLREAGERGVLVVYLRATPEVLAQRIRKQPGKRPLIDRERVLNLPETRARVQELLQQRAPLYEETANLIIETGATTPTRIARQIEQTLKSKI